MARCTNCGAHNRDTAKFCAVCGKQLSATVPAVPRVPTPISPPHWLSSGQGAGPVPIHSAQPGVAQGAPLGFPKIWSGAQPRVEGKVVHVEAPIQERAPIIGKVAAAGILALIAPILAFLPFARGAQITVRYIRIEDAQTGQQRSVKIQGEPSGIISVGDWAAIWGKSQSGNIIMNRAFNYTTDAEIGLKK